MRASHLGDRLHQLLAVGEQLGDARLRLRQREQDVLGGDVLVAEAGRLLLRLLEDPDELGRGPDVRDGVPAQLRELLDRLVRATACLPGIDPEPLQNRDDDALVLIEEGGEEVGGSDLRVRALGREPLRGCHRFLGANREPVWLHQPRMVAALVANVKKSMSRGLRYSRHGLGELWGGAALCRP